MNPVRFDTLTRSLTTARSRRGTLASLLGGTLGLLGLTDTVAKKKGKKKGKGKDNKNKKKKRKTPNPCPEGTQCGPCHFCLGGVCKPCTKAEGTACSDASFACEQAANQTHCNCYCGCGEDEGCRNGCRSEYMTRAIACQAQTPECSRQCGSEVISCYPFEIRPGICLCAK